ncbi:MAG: hypothetical protein ACRC8S_02290 [Fimbriiglobus sp.]
MSTKTGSFWPTFSLDVNSPEFILRQQAKFLNQSMNGTILAEITKLTGEEDLVSIRMELIAVRLHRARYRILTVVSKAEPYPVQLEADVYKPKTLRVDQGNWAEATVKKIFEPYDKPLTWPPVTDWRKIASNKSEFDRCLAEVFNSNEVRSVVESILARTNDLQMLEEAEAESQTPTSQP